MVSSKSNRFGAGINTDKHLEQTVWSLVPEAYNITRIVNILNSVYQLLYSKVAVAYAKEYNRMKNGSAQLNHIAFSQAVEGQLKMRERQRLMDEARTAAHQLAHELARNMTLNTSQRDVEMSN
jgi:hypothetical protein